MTSVIADAITEVLFIKTIVAKYYEKIKENRLRNF